ncbi:50S ribosomal protein L21, partial [Elusimicrobiota bacterium]
MKYAIVENGRNQVIVKEGEAVLVDDLDLEKGKPYTWSNVLVIKDGDDIKVGTPYIKGSKVKGKVDVPAKGPKVINFKKKRRKGYTRKVG